MIARDNVTGGCWVVRPNGNVYTFNGAQYIGPLPKYLAQWGIGIVVDIARAELAVDTAGGLMTAFAMSLAAQLLAYAWFMFGWRRHTVVIAAALSGPSFRLAGPGRDDAQAH